ncbi:MAG: C4-type zinc ribbon domain-containing protein, partial [Bacteroidota bacterium]|nr:C4-type zinc ribbon domain-containing protein [Bacteroidota bacterium]
DKLKQLYELQIIDSEKDQIQIIKGELPMAVSDLEDEIAGLNTRITKLQASITDFEKENGNHKVNVKQSEDAIKKYEKQLDGVKNNREYDALNKEINLQRLEIQLSDKKMKEGIEQIKAKKVTLDGVKERMTQKQEDLNDKKDELTKILEKTDKEEQTLINKSEKFRKKIEARLLHAYDTIRKRYRNGLAVVMVKRSSCGGCFAQIPPQVQLEIGLRKKIIACEHCGRVLVDDQILESVE